MLWPQVDFGFLCKAVNPGGLVCPARRAIGRDSHDGVQRVRFRLILHANAHLTALLPASQLQYLVEASEDKAEFIKRILFEAEKLFGYPLGGGHMDRACVSGTAVAPPTVSSPARTVAPLRQVTFRFVDGSSKTLDLSDDTTVAEVKRQLNVSLTCRVRHHVRDGRCCAGVALDRECPAPG